MLAGMLTRRRQRQDGLPRHILEAGALYHDWEAGRLPVGGGVLDQTQWFVDAMRFLGARVSEIHEEDEARRRVGARQKQEEDPAEAARKMRKTFGEVTGSG